MTGVDQLGDGGRGEADPIFVVLDLFGDADAHIRLLMILLGGPIAARFGFVAVAEAAADMLDAGAFPT
jgi:hypothetical protein